MVLSAGEGIVCRPGGQAVTMKVRDAQRGRARDGRQPDGLLLWCGGLTPGGWGRASTRGPGSARRRVGRGWVGMSNVGVVGRSLGY